MICVVCMGRIQRTVKYALDGVNVSLLEQSLVNQSISQKVKTQPLLDTKWRGRGSSSLDALIETCTTYINLQLELLYNSIELPRVGL